jgi:hypothetical protein
MSIYKVKRDYEGGIWVKNHPDPIVEVRASNPDEAVESVFGRRLSRRGRKEQYCAQVWPMGGVRHAHQIEHFYSA